MNYEKFLVGYKKTGEEILISMLDENHYIDLTTGEYKEYEDFAQTYFPEDDNDFFRNFDFSDYKLSATVIPVISENMELEATITENKELTAVNTSTAMYKAVSNMKDYNICYYKGYGNLYKLTIPKKTAVFSIVFFPSIF